MIWLPTLPRRPTLARIAQFNRTETAFPDHVTLQELIEAQMDRHPARERPSSATTTMFWARHRSPTRSSMKESINSRIG